MLRRRFSTSGILATTFAASTTTCASGGALLLSQKRTALADYRSPIDFEPTQMKFFCDGVESEMMDDTRKVALAAVQAHRLTTSNRSIERETGILRDRIRFMLNPPSKILQTRSDKTSGSIAETSLVTLAQYRTTPGKFWALYEATAMIDAPLAYALATHFSLASCITSVYRPHMGVITSGGIDNGTTFFTGAHQEVIADDVPYQTMVETDHDTGTLKVCSRDAGGGKVIQCLGSSARYALTSVQFRSPSGATKPHLMLIELRDASGKLRKGVTMKGLGSTGGAVDGLASCIVHFDDVRVPPECLLTADILPDGTTVGREASLDAAAEMNMSSASTSTSTSTTTQKNKTKEGDEEDKTKQQQHGGGGGPLAQNAMLNLVTCQRLATASLALGKTKRMVHDIVRFSASKKIIGPEGERDYPAMGVQSLQRRVALVVAEVYVMTAAYQRVARIFSNPGLAHKLTMEDFVELAAISSEIVEMCARTSKVGLELCGWQAVPATSGFSEGLALSAMWREGTHPDYVKFLYSRECVENKIGLLKNTLMIRHKVFGSTRLGKLLTNPMFSVTSNDINRYLLLFGDKELASREKLQDEMRAAERKGAEDMFMVWNNEANHDVLSHSDAYLNVLAVRSVYEILQKNRDPFNSKIINDCSWLWSLTRIQNDLGWYLQNKALSVRQIRHVQIMIDNLSNIIANQAVHMVDCFGIPRTELDSPLPRDWEAYWGPTK